MVQKPTWGKDQPNNYNGEQNCVVLDGGRNWLWNDVGCNLDYLHFICQHCRSCQCHRHITSSSHFVSLYHLPAAPLSCGSPDAQQNTTVMGKKFTLGEKIQYTCPKGHSLLGQTERECRLDGTWSGSSPTCKCKRYCAIALLQLAKNKEKCNDQLSRCKQLCRNIMANGLQFHFL